MTNTAQIDEETGEIVGYSKFDQQLAEATTPAEVNKVVFEINMVLKLLDAVNAATEQINELQIPRLKAIRQGGGMLAHLPRGQGNQYTAKVEAAGIAASTSAYQQGRTEAQLSERMARYWQQVYAIPEDSFNDYIDHCLATNNEISLMGFIVFAKRPHVANNSGENEWYTPREFIEAARATMGSIDLDPASSEIANQIVQAGAFYTLEDDGLAQDWFGNVWLNPPYAQPEVSYFADKVVSEAENVQQVCILVNNATETAWFQSLLGVIDAVCLLRSRVKFLDTQLKPNGAPLQGQIILYAGANTALFVEHFSPFGVILDVHA
jgi:phage N-6-adenine-methyltransferase